MMKLTDVVEMINDVKEDGFKDWELEVFGDTIEDVNNVLASLENENDKKICKDFIKQMQEEKDLIEKTLNILDDVASEKSTKRKAPGATKGKTKGKTKGATKGKGKGATKGKGKSEGKNKDKNKADAKDRKSTRLNSSHANISYAVF